MASFKIGDLVWAKMKGFPPWPGLISEPPESLKEVVNLKKNTCYHCIFFFGSKNYGWIENEKLKPYLAYKNELKNSTKSLKFTKACREIEEFSEKHNISYNCEDRFDQLLDSTNAEKAVKQTKEIISEEQPIAAAIGFDKLFPSIRIEKLDESLTELASKVTNPKKRLLESQKKVIVKKKKHSYSVADTTTPVDSSIMFEPTDVEESKESVKEDPVYNITKDFRDSEINETETLNETSNSLNDSSSREEVIPCEYKIGFLGLGVMGRGIVKNLLQTGHAVTLWNRSSDKINEFRNMGARIVSTAGEVVAECDITFCCVSDSDASKQVMFKSDGAIEYLAPGKSYVDITSVDIESSLDLSEAVFSKGARYLEVRLEGSIKEADEGSLVCLAAGEQSLYNDCSSFFKACSKKAFFLGEVGNASKMHLIIQLMTGVTLAGLAESLALADRAGLDHSDLMKILKLSQINCPLILDKSKAMLDGDWATKNALRNLQSNIRYALMMGDSNEHPTPMAATANELFKHAKKLGYGEHDVSAIFLGARF